MRSAELFDTELTPDQLSFRDDVRALLRSPEVQDEVARILSRPEGEEPGVLGAFRLLGERGWLAPGWPRRFGGLGFGHAECAIVTEEMILAGLPDDAHVLSIDIVGKFIEHCGTDRQRERFLPPLARGEMIATVLLTEPGCGSDLSRMQTRAAAEGGGWRLHGTKVYSQKSGFGDVALCAAVTTPGPTAIGGVTLFLLPLRAPGVTIRNVPNLTYDAFCEISIDGVLLTRDDVLGEVDDGWRLLDEMLVYERTGIDYHAKTRRWLDSAVAAAGGRAALDPLLGARLEQIEARLAAAHALAWQVVAGLDRGRPDPVGAAMAKWYATEQARDVARFCLDLHGREGLLAPWDPSVAPPAPVDTALRHAPTVTMSAGTSEVMLHIIASTHLELL